MWYRSKYNYLINIMILIRLKNNQNFLLIILKSLGYKNLCFFSDYFNYLDIKFDNFLLEISRMSL